METRMESCRRSSRLGSQPHAGIARRRRPLRCGRCARSWAPNAGRCSESPSSWGHGIESVRPWVRQADIDGNPALAPPVVLVRGFTQQPLNFGRITFTVDTLIVPVIQSVHRQPDLTTTWNCFDRNGSSSSAHRLRAHSLWGGPRRCLADWLAVVQAMVILATCCFSRSRRCRSVARNPSTSMAGLHSQQRRHRARQSIRLTSRWCAFASRRTLLETFS
jgi:hypothetical protein